MKDLFLMDRLMDTVSYATKSEAIHSKENGKTMFLTVTENRFGLVHRSMKEISQME